MSIKKVYKLNSNPEGFGLTANKLDANMFASKLPVQHSHIYYSDRDLGLYVGVWDTTDMVEAAGAYPCDEFMWLIEGDADIKNNRTGAIETVHAGEAFAIPRGYDCQWHQTGYLRKFFMIYEDPSEPVPTHPALEGIAIPKTTTDSSASANFSPFICQGDKLLQRADIAYSNHSGKFLAGTWESEPFESERLAFPFYYLAYVQEGALSLIDDQDVEYCFHPGDTFFVPEGVICGGVALQPLRLIFASVRPACS